MAAWWPLLLLAQFPVEPGSPADSRVRALWNTPIGKRLTCEVRKYPANLGFDFRYWAGADFQLDLKQFEPLQPNRRLYMLLRVTPEGREAKYFLNFQPLPEAGDLPQGTSIKRLQIQVGGGVHLGAGSYKMEALVLDDTERGCRASWAVTAKAVAQPLRQEPLTVGVRRGVRTRTAQGEASQKVVVVLNADTWSPRRYSSKLSAWDRSALIDSLMSMVDTWNTAEFTAYLLHLENRKLVYQGPVGGPGSSRRLMEAMNAIETGKVDIASLRRGASGEYLAQFVERESDKWSRADAVVFLGPAWRWTDRIPDALKRKLSGVPRLYHVALIPAVMPADNIVRQFVSSQDGRLFRVSKPADLASAIRKIRSDFAPEQGESRQPDR
jgi:hypothetical protein